MDKPIQPQKAYKNLDFLNSSAARPIRILSEYYEPLERFKHFNIQSTIVFFGSARVQTPEIQKEKLIEAEKKYQDDPSDLNEKLLEKARLSHRLTVYYQYATDLSKKFTEWALKENKDQRFYVCSGGGPGIMEAANKGANLAGGQSIGLNISIPMEQYPNPFITPDLSFEFHYFFMRKYWFVYMAKALVIFPGGFGTLDELMEVLTLIQTKKVNKKMPILIFGQDYWKEIINLNAMARWGTISDEDLSLFTFVNSVEEALEILINHLTKQDQKPARTTK